MLCLGMLYTALDTALATDYDGTLAHDGLVPQETLDALKQLKDRGKALIMVTGRELPDLQRVFPEVGLFDAIVAENGALLFLPKAGEQVLLGPEPPADFFEALRSKNVTPLSIGVASSPPGHPMRMWCWRRCVNSASNGRPSSTRRAGLLRLWNI